MLRDRGDQRLTLEEVRGAEPRDGQGLLAAGGSGQELPGREPVAGGGGGGQGLASGPGGWCWRGFPRGAAQERGAGCAVGAGLRGRGREGADHVGGTRTC